MINCERVFVQRVVLLFFPAKFKQTVRNKRNQDCRNFGRNVSGTSPNEVLKLFFCDHDLTNQLETIVKAKMQSELNG